MLDMMTKIQTTPNLLYSKELDDGNYMIFEYHQRILAHYEKLSEEQFHKYVSERKIKQVKIFSNEEQICEFQVQDPDAVIKTSRNPKK